MVPVLDHGPKEIAASSGAVGEASLADCYCWAVVEDPLTLKYVSNQQGYLVEKHSYWMRKLFVKVALADLRYQKEP